ncbi:MAG: hypothetical protein WEC59_11250 [Salibacteraceae bacterium]
MRKILLLLFTAAFALQSNAQLSVTPGDTSLCPGDSITYTASGMTVLGWIDTLNQDTVMNASYTFTTTVEGTHTIYAVGINVFPQDTDTIGIDITINAPPAVSIISSGGSGICEGSSTELIGLPAMAASYEWSPEASLDTNALDTVIATPDTTTTYYLTVTDALGCVGMDSIEISVESAPEVTVSSTAEPDNGYVCAGNSATLTATASNVASYEWSPVSTLSDSNTVSVIATPTGNTTYTVVVTDSNGCTASTSVLVRVNNSYPTMTILPEETEICQGESVFIDVLSTGVLYSWTPAATVDDPTEQDVTVTPTSTTTYTVETRLNGCDTTGSVTISVNPSPAVGLTQTGGSASICLDETAELTASCPNCDSYLWKLPNSTFTTVNTVQTISPNTPGTFTISVTGFDTLGCGGKASVTLNVDDCYVGTPFGVEENKEAQISIMRKTASIAIESNEPITAMKLYNLLGEEVLALSSNNEHRIEFSTGNFASGVYITTLQLSSGETITKKLYL